MVVRILVVVAFLITGCGTSSTQTPTNNPALSEPALQGAQQAEALCAQHPGVSNLAIPTPSAYVGVPDGSYEFAGPCTVTLVGGNAFLTSH